MGHGVELTTRKKKIGSTLDEKEKETGKGANWIYYYYKSSAFMHHIPFFLSLHISKEKEMKSSKCKVKFPFFFIAKQFS